MEFLDGSEVGEEEVVRATWSWPSWEKMVEGSECANEGEEFRPHARVRAG